MLALGRWAETASEAINIHRSSSPHEEYAELGYHKHLNHASRWRLRKAIEQALDSAEELPSRKMQDFARCVVLRTAQWALDGRKSLPSISEFRHAICSYASEMLVGATAFRKEVRRQEVAGRVTLINRSAEGLDSDKNIKGRTAPIDRTSFGPTCWLRFATTHYLRTARAGATHGDTLS